MAAAKIREAAILVTRAWATYAASMRLGNRQAMAADYENVREAIHLLDEAVREATRPPDGGRAA